MYWSFGIVAHFFCIICLVNAGCEKELQISNKRLHIPSTFDRLEACLNESDLLFSNTNEHRDIFRMRHNHIRKLINAETLESCEEIEDIKLRMFDSLASYLPLFRHKALSNGANYEVKQLVRKDVKSRNHKLNKITVDLVGKYDDLSLAHLTNNTSGTISTIFEFRNLTSANKNKWQLHTIEIIASEENNHHALSRSILVTTQYGEIVQLKTTLPNDTILLQGHMEILNVEFELVDVPQYGYFSSPLFIFVFIVICSVGLIVLIVICAAMLIKHVPARHLEKFVDVKLARSSNDPVAPEEDDGYDELSYEDNDQQDNNSFSENENSSLTSNEENLFRISQPIGIASDHQRLDSVESGNDRDREQRRNLNREANHTITHYIDQHNSFMPEDGDKLCSYTHDKGEHSSIIISKKNTNATGEPNEIFPSDDTDSNNSAEELLECISDKDVEIIEINLALDDYNIPDDEKPVSFQNSPAFSGPTQGSKLKARSEHFGQKNNEKEQSELINEGCVELLKVVESPYYIEDSPSPSTNVVVDLGDNQPPSTTNKPSNECSKTPKNSPYLDQSIHETIETVVLMEKYHKHPHERDELSNISDNQTKISENESSIPQGVMDTDSARKGSLNVSVMCELQSKLKTTEDKKVMKDVGKTNASSITGGVMDTTKMKKGSLNVNLMSELQSKFRDEDNKTVQDNGKTSDFVESQPSMPYPQKESNQMMYRLPHLTSKQSEPNHMPSTGEVMSRGGSNITCKEDVQTTTNISRQNDQIEETNSDIRVKIKKQTKHGFSKQGIAREIEEKLRQKNTNSMAIMASDNDNPSIPILPRQTKSVINLVTTDENEKCDFLPVRQTTNEEHQSLKNQKKILKAPFKNDRKIRKRREPKTNTSLPSTPFERKRRSSSAGSLLPLNQE